MKKGLLVLALLVATAGSLAADQAAPELLAHADGAFGVDTGLAAVSGADLGGGQAGLEWMPAGIPGQVLGLDMDYSYLDEHKNAVLNGADNDVDLSLRWLPWTSGITSLSLQGGIGYNTTPTDINGHYLAFIEPGVRVIVAPRVAIDGGVQFMVTTPSDNMVQSVAVTLGVSIPLDAPFTTPMSESSPASAGH
jgi:hypothetical protein